MMWIEENHPAAKTLPGESFEEWRARGAPTFETKWFIWEDAGPGHAEAVAGPFDTWQEARASSNKLFPHAEILDRHPCSCKGH